MPASWSRALAVTPLVTLMLTGLAVPGHGSGERAGAEPGDAGPSSSVAEASAPQPVARAVTVRRAAQRVVAYRVETRGKLRADVKVFKRRARATYGHPRGWGRAGITFRQVRRGGSFSLVLAEASWLPRFSSACSREWSCRVGRYVVINQTRWLRATPLWRREGGTLRGYRHLVINHETGHWLGLGHRGCPRRGAPAPVMQTQSKGLYGCRINAFPKPGEIAAAR